MVCMDGCDSCTTATNCDICSLGWAFDSTNSYCEEVDTTCYGDSYWKNATYECCCNNPDTYYDATPG
jgi:hypothetical protein